MAARKRRDDQEVVASYFFFFFWEGVMEYKRCSETRERKNG